MTTRGLMRIGGLAVLAACGRVGFDPAADAATGPASDAVIDAALACTTFGPFGPPVRVPELSSPGDDNALSMTADQLHVMLEREVADGFALFQASRPSIDSPFSTPTLVAELETGTFDANPSLSPDGLTVYFASGPPLSQIYVATRADRTSPFSAPSRLPIGAGDLSDVCAPEISDDGQELIFNRFIGAIQNSDLLRAVWNPTSGRFEIDPPDGLVELGRGTATNEYVEAWASLSSGGRTIHFASTRCDSEGSICPGTGEAWRIYTAERPAPGAPFGPPRLLSELPLEAGADDGDPELSADGTTLWFSSNRPGGAGGYDIWSATRVCVGR